jgi:hypothetical protein
MSFYESLKKRGKLKDDDLMPDFSEGENLLMQIFTEISTARHIGMGIGPIPAEVYWEAQKRYGLTEAALSALKLLDMEFVKQNAGN